MSGVREPAVAGRFYPSDPAELERTVRDLLAGAVARARAPKALVAPHAGYVYSGPVAASAYACAPKWIERVVLLGPAHRVFFRGLARSGASGFRTPLGVVPLEEAPDLPERDDAHRGEHSLEVQLPFLQVAIGPFTLLPVLVGDAEAAEVASFLDAHWGGAETLVVVSSDLSHYHDSETARRLDAATSEAIEALDGDRLGPEDACGFQPIRGLLETARRRRLRVVRLDLRNSGDTAGPRDEVVGYGAFAAVEAVPRPLP